MAYREAVILLNEKIGPNIYKLVVEGQFEGEPGQFYMLRGWNGLDPFLARPFSIGDLDEGKISFFYEERGRATRIMSDLQKGQKLSLLGPLGRGFPYKRKGRIALVAGGIGIAPIYYLAKRLAVKGDLFLGFRNHTYLTEELTPYGEEIFISTEDGSIGHKGYIVDILDPKKYDLIMACGPSPMLKAIMDKSGDKIKLYLSMESHMGCGVGTCLGCTIKTSSGMERVCKEGPVFSGREVLFYD
ncbi:MAG TPA: dihydroorotate dehydrogenase electron transfer subunit [Tissierellaceae bacterium]|nr:dihydroorotate dehydrogenase electron transfer subunit [Tissierellaceae bacterium]